jgi:purine-binding chemotaxis protein CheW
MAAPEAERQLVVFSLHGEQYAVPIGCVREIIRYIEPSASAAASGLVQGVINVRGHVLPVVDLSSKLGRQLEVDRRTKILVVELAKGPLGLIVDSVEEVLTIPADRIEPLPAALAQSGLGDQIVAVGERLIMLLDAERALGGVLAAPPARRRRRTT